jgi:hypothetical protein
MIVITLKGIISDVSKIEYLPGGKRPYQRIILQVFAERDSLGRITEKDNFFYLFIYGSDEIGRAWLGYDDYAPSPPVTVNAQLTGRLTVSKNNTHNNITLRLINWKFHYDNK